MACKNVCRLCPKLIISQSIAVESGAVNIDIPTGTYVNGQKYCLVLAQALPTAATLNMPVYVTIGGVTTTLYPLNQPNGVQVTASGLRTRTRYAIRVATTADGGSFNLLAYMPTSIPQDVAQSIPV